jgi:hypothetical protein
MVIETTHHLPSKIGVLIGKETAHGTKATTIDKVAGRGVVFAETVSENDIEVYDPAEGQAMVEVVQGQKDVGGSLNFDLVDWQWLGWLMGTDDMNEIQISNEVGVFAATDTITGLTSGFTATIDSRSGDEFTLTNITGLPVQGETFEDATTLKTATLQAFIHDITLGDYPDSLTVENIFEQLLSSENYIGMRGSEATLVSTRGEIVPVDMTLVGIDEETNTINPSSKVASTKTPWTWDKGSITLNSDDYDNVCDSANIEFTRNCTAQGGHNRIAHEVVPGNFRTQLTLDMDLPSNGARVLRRANTKVSAVITFTETTNEQVAILTFTNLQVISDIRDTSKDAETVRVSVVGKTGQFSARIYDDIFAY